MTRDLTPLGQYIYDLCQDQNLSMREASMRAGLAPETISQILRRGDATMPRPDTLKLIAEALCGDYWRMLELAGYVEPRSGTVTDIPRLQQFVDRLSQLPRDAQARIMAAALHLVEIDEAARSASEDILSDSPQSDGDTD